MTAIWPTLPFSVKTSHLHYALTQRVNSAWPRGFLTPSGWVQALRTCHNDEQASARMKVSSKADMSLIVTDHVRSVKPGCSQAGWVVMAPISLV